MLATLETTHCTQLEFIWTVCYYCVYIYDVEFCCNIKTKYYWTIIRFVHTSLSMLWISPGPQGLQMVLGCTRQANASGHVFFPAPRTLLIQDASLSESIYVGQLVLLALDYGTPSWTSFAALFLGFIPSRRFITPSRRCVTTRSPLIQYSWRFFNKYKLWAF